MPDTTAISSLTLAEPIRVLSDLHLGHPGCRIDDVSQLAPLIDGAATVIFNGDTSEERSDRFAVKGRQMFGQVESLCTELGATPIFTTGNHDPYTPEHHAIDLYDGKIFITHGDVIFPSVSPWSKFHDAALEAMHRIHAEHTPEQLQDLETLLHINKRISAEMKVRQPKARPGLWGKARTLLNEVWPPTRPLTILNVWATAHRTAHDFFQHHRPQAEVIIIGHTHRPYQSQKNDRTILNTGAFLAFSKSTLIEIQNGQVTIHQIIKVGETFKKGKAQRFGEIDT
jgi:predicted phosphodiesterase